MDITPERLLEILNAFPGESLSVRRILDEAGALPAFKPLALHNLLALVKEGKAVRLGDKHFCAARQARRARGVVRVSERGLGFLIQGAVGGGDLFIYTDNLGSAMDGDTVEAEVFLGRKGRDEGRVLEVLERAHKHVVGQFRRTGAGGSVTPRNPRIGRMVELHKAPPANELRDGAWVRARVTRWPRGFDDDMQGELEEVLGMPGERGISVLVLLRDMGVETEFPAEVLRRVERLHPPSEREFARRRDLRGDAVCTIDPITAKDHDDALSIRPLENGNWLLGVHIADVAHYVGAGGPVDHEALRRGTSIYPVDRVVPMLPERLSNDLCSLREGEDRPALTCEMEIDKAGRVLRREIYESVIHSRHKLCYEEVQEFFDNPQRRAEFRFADMGEELLLLRAVARALTQMRMDRGALDLDLPEARVDCNAEGDAIGLARRARLESHRLVEECMLIANETVAEFLRAKGMPFLYRIHDIPDPSALGRLAPALEMFGVKVPKKVEPKPAFYQPLVDQLHHRDGGHIGQRLLLGSLMRAEYSPDNRHHFGLASKCYCHFTSPIRRYPDLLTHRIIKDLLQGRTEEPEYKEKLRDELPPTANQCNLTEENAESIEREAEGIKAMEFMQDQVGGIFEGWISRIMRRGFLVELEEYPVEGFVPLRALNDDYYTADEFFTRLTGQHTRRTLRLGQRVEVQVNKVEVIAGEMELFLAPEGKSRKKGGGRRNWEADGGGGKGKSGGRDRDGGTGKPGGGRNKKKGKRRGAW